MLAGSSSPLTLERPLETRTWLVATNPVYYDLSGRRELLWLHIPLR